LLVNGESEPAILSEQIEPLLPPFGRRLEVVIIPSCRQDQLSGLFGLTRQVRVGQVLWGCDPAERQISERLWNAFATESIPQTRLTGEEMLTFQQGSMEFGIVDGNLGSLLIHQEDFTARVTFAGAKEDMLSSASLVIQPEEQNQAEFDAQVRVLTGDGDREKAPFALWARDYLWLQVQTDGKQIWLFSKTP
jgi:hypothetical protein